MLSRDIEFSPATEIVIRARKFGTGKPTCLLVHGFGEGGYVWDNVVDVLATQCQTIVFDLRGHGNSSWDPLARYDARTHATDLLHAVNSMALEEIIIIGHSLGAEIAMRIYLARPDLIKSLILVDFSPAPEPAAVLRLLADLKDSDRCYRSHNEYVDWLLDRRPLLQHETAEQIALSALRINTVGTFQLKSDPALYQNTTKIEAEVPTNARWEILRRINCPTLFVRGAGSAVLRNDIANRVVTEHLANGHLETIPMAGHAVMSDNPRAFAKAAEHFINQQRRCAVQPNSNLSDRERTRT